MLVISMAASKLWFLSLLLLLALISSTCTADESAPASSSETQPNDAWIEVEQLKSKIQILEKHVGESSLSLKSKDETIAKLEKTIQEKSDNVAIMQNSIELVQRKGKLELEQKVGKANARADELQKQVDLLKKEIEGQNKEKDALEERALETEKKIEELTLKLDNLQKINDEQKILTERALQVAEEELIKAKVEATSRTKKLLEGYGACLPLWLEDHAVRLEAIIETKWDEHGKSVVEIFSQKMLEMNAEFQIWAEPHLETIKTKWIPVAEEHWVTIIESVEPHVQTLSTRARELYESSKDAMKPLIIKVQEVGDPYYEEIRKFSKPYVDQLATVVEPHAEKARVALEPYTNKAVDAYRKFLETMTTYHYQLQDIVHEKLKNYTKHLTTKELIWFVVSHHLWFVASAVLALPVIVLYNIISLVLGKKVKTSQGTRSQNIRRKGKRGHPDE